MKAIKKGVGNACPKCKKNMERRGHKQKPTTAYYFSEWDYCIPCGHVQHYEEFKRYSNNADGYAAEHYENLDRISKF